MTTKAFDLNEELTKTKNSITNLLLRGKDMLEASRTISEEYNLLFEENLKLKEQIINKRKRKNDHG
jgi:hypothetical protein